MIPFRFSEWQKNTRYFSISRLGIFVQRLGNSSSQRSWFRHILKSFLAVSVLEQSVQISLMIFPFLEVLLLYRVLLGVKERKWHRNPWGSCRAGRRFVPWGPQPGWTHHGWMKRWIRSVCAYGSFEFGFHLRPMSKVVRDSSLLEPEFHSRSKSVAVHDRPRFWEGASFSVGIENCSWSVRRFGASSADWKSCTFLIYALFQSFEILVRKRKWRDIRGNPDRVKSSFVFVFVFERNLGSEGIARSFRDGQFVFQRRSVRRSELAFTTKHIFNRVLQHASRMKRNGWNV